MDERRDDPLLGRFVELSVREGWPLASVLKAPEGDRRAVFAALSLYAGGGKSAGEAARAFLAGAGSFIRADAAELAGAWLARGQAGLPKDASAAAELEARVRDAARLRSERQEAARARLQRQNLCANRRRIACSEAEDLRFMQEAYALALEARDAGEVPVGAVVALDGAVLGRGSNRTIRDTDPTAHAEIVAIREAARASGNRRLGGATLYVTLEPCPMCTGAAAHARIGRVVFAASDPRAGALGGALDLSRHPAILRSVEVSRGPMAPECEALLKSFFELRRRASPPQDGG